MINRRATKPIGIVDIGSNSIRLCVYDGASRVPVPLFNEKAVCSLALGLEGSGRLNPDGVSSALAAVGRFIALARAMTVTRLDVLATAAVRDAEDGMAFAQELERRYGVSVAVLTGAEEAHLSAMGVLCGAPDAEGIVCDLGGGSLELVRVKGRRFADHVTLPLGVLRLSEASGDDRARAQEIVDGHLAGLDWLGEGKGGILYAVGGAWRSLARLSIAHTNHPLTVLDNFTLETPDALRIAHLVSSQSRKSLEKSAGVSRKRLASLPLAALVLERIIGRVQPRQLAFSIYGMREGRFYETLPPKTRKEDPLLSVCRQLAVQSCRFAEHGDEVMAWTAPLFPNETPVQTRLRHAACLLSDAFWNEHPDYRAEQAYLRILRLPFMGITHDERAAVALTVYTRYQRDGDDLPEPVGFTMLDEVIMERCRAVGTALRLAHTLTGGAPNLLPKTRVMADGGNLVLEVPAGDPIWNGDPDRALDRLARALGCQSLVFRRVG